MLRRLMSLYVDQQIFVSDLAIPKNQTLAPGLESLSWLQSYAPCFGLNGNNIRIIQDPKIFYEVLKDKCASAKERIIMTSLYLGTGALEKDLILTIQNNLRNNEPLKVDFLLEYTRGTRGIENSKSLLLPLIQEFHPNFSLSMYHTPVLRGFTKRWTPSRWNELLGLQHMKVYLIDDSVILSGANLSTDYFTNRQDRYIVIKDRHLSDFYAKFIGKVQEFSLCVDKSSETSLHNSWKFLPYEGVQEDFVTEAKNRICDFFDDVLTDQSQRLQSQNEVTDTWIFPLIEMGQLGIHHDSIVTKQLLQSSIKGSKMKLATGYFNLTQEYMNTITSNCLAQCSVLMAHPNANGFQGARGPAGGIPAAYSLIAKNFYESLVTAKQDHRVSFFEFEKPGWTYHAKGMWYYLPGSDHPNLTLIGSSNFGERSVNRDLETQVCLVTQNTSLKNRLQDEVNNLYSLGSSAEHEIISRPVPRWVQAVVQVFRNFF